MSDRNSLDGFTDDPKPVINLSYTAPAPPPPPRNWTIEQTRAFTPCAVHTSGLLVTPLILARHRHAFEDVHMFLTRWGLTRSFWARARAQFSRLPSSEPARECTDDAEVSFRCAP